jgi:cbb3-type cytochrome oxidase subunit 3
MKKLLAILAMVLIPVWVFAYDPYGDDDAAEQEEYIEELEDELDALDEWERKYEHFQRDKELGVYGTGSLPDIMEEKLEHERDRIR